MKLNPKNYHVENMKKMSKKHFMKAYGSNKLFNAEALWKYLHPPKKKGGDKSKDLAT